jgi:hypothetical protein
MPNQGAVHFWAKPGFAQETYIEDGKVFPRMGKRVQWALKPRWMMGAGAVSPELTFSKRGLRRCHTVEGNKRPT